MHRRNLKVKRVFGQVNEPPPPKKKEWWLKGQELGKKRAGAGHYLGRPTFRYCRRASNSAFRIDVPYKVSSLRKVRKQRLSEPTGCGNTEKLSSGVLRTAAPRHT